MIFERFKLSGVVDSTGSLGSVRKTLAVNRKTANIEEKNMPKQSYENFFLSRAKSGFRRCSVLILLILFSSLLAHGQETRSSEPRKTAAAVSAEFPSQYFSSHLPNPRLAAYFPHRWTTYAANEGRNAAFAIPDTAPAALRDGVSWEFAGAGAIPLDGPPLNGGFPATAYTIGMPVGVTAVDGIVYVGSDSGYTYALNAITGKLIWSHYGWNMNMSNPLVVDGHVFVSTGNAYFNYMNTMLYVKGARPTRGPGLNSMYALDAKTGKELWAYHFPGEAMATPVFSQGFLYIGTGDGHVYKLDATTGKLAWSSDLVSFVSMSSPVIAGHYLFVGGTNPNFFYALDKNSGRIIWKVTLPSLVATGMGDCTPAYGEGLVIQEATVSTGDEQNPVLNVLLALDAHTGRIVWQKRFDKGPTPPAMKTATPVVVGGVVFEGSPVTGDYFALDLRTGRELWKVHLGAAIRAGAAVANGVVYLPYSSGDIVAIRAADGTIVGKKPFGGAFGPSSPVIVGGTLYVSNIYGWVIAVPLSEIRASLEPQHRQGSALQGRGKSQFVEQGGGYTSRSHKRGN